MRWDCSEAKTTYSSNAAFECGGNSHARRWWQSRSKICSSIPSSESISTPSGKATSIRPNPSEDSSRTPRGGKKWTFERLASKIFGFVVHFSDGLVTHPGSREAINAQIHKRLSEQPWLVPSFGHFPPRTWNPLSFRDASRRPQRQPFMILFFLQRNGASIPSSEPISTPLGKATSIQKTEVALQDKVKNGRSYVLHPRSDAINRWILCTKTYLRVPMETGTRTTCRVTSDLAQKSGSHFGLEATRHPRFLRGPASFASVPPPHTIGLLTTSRMCGHSRTPDGSDTAVFLKEAKFHGDDETEQSVTLLRSADSAASVPCRSLGAVD